MTNLVRVLSVSSDVAFMVDEFFKKSLLGVGSTGSKFWNAVDDVHAEVKTVEVIADHHIKGGGGGSFFFVTADV